MSKIVGGVLKLFVSVKGSNKRIVKSELNVDINGVLGDKFYAKDLERSILLASYDSYTLAKKYEVDMPFGTLGENILIDYNPYLLTIGTQLKMGTAILQITQNCTICNHLSVIDKKLPKLLKDDRGIFVKVMVEGIIKEGDKVYLID